MFQPVKVILDGARNETSPPLTGAWLLLFLAGCAAPPPAVPPASKVPGGTSTASIVAERPADALTVQEPAPLASPAPSPLPDDPTAAFHSAPSNEEGETEDAPDAGAVASTGRFVKRALSESWCRTHTGYGPAEPFESCSVELLGAGAVLLLRIVTECGGDSCGVRGWVHTRQKPGFTAVPGDLGGTVAASPTGEFLVIDAATSVGVPADKPARDPFGGRDELVLDRIDLPTFTRRPFAPCFSAVLSPRARFFVCRDRAGNVLRVPVAGGRPERVARSGLLPRDVDWVPYAYVYPGPVDFPTAERLVFTVGRPDGSVLRKEAPFRE